MRRPPNTFMASSPKSSPTTPTRRTSVKNEAATQKYVAAPPITRAFSPKGVFTESNAH